MAKKAAMRGDQKPKVKKSKKLWYFSLMLIGAYFFLPFFVVLIVGMLPTLIVWFIELHPLKFAGKSTLASNSVGCLFVSEEMLRIEGAQTLDNAINLLFDTTNLTIMIGAAGPGLLIYILTPKFISLSMEIKCKGEINKAEKKRREMLSKWGNDLEQNAPRVLSNSEIDRKFRDMERAKSLSE